MAMVATFQLLIGVRERGLAASTRGGYFTLVGGGPRSPLNLLHTGQCLGRNRRLRGAQLFNPRSPTLASGLFQMPILAQRAYSNTSI